MVMLSAPWYCANWQWNRVCASKFQPRHLVKLHRLCSGAGAGARNDTYEENYWTVWTYTVPCLEFELLRLELWIIGCIVEHERYRIEGLAILQNGCTIAFPWNRKKGEKLSVTSKWLHILESCIEWLLVVQMRLTLLILWKTSLNEPLLSYGV